MSIEGVVSALLVGLLLGVLGRLVVPGRNRIGCLMTVVVGVLAALLGSVARLGGRRRGRRLLVGPPGVQVLVAAFGVALLTGFSRRRDR